MARTKTEDEKLITVEEEDGRVTVYAAVSKGEAVKASPSEDKVNAALGDSWRDGPLLIPGPNEIDNFRSPKLSVPGNYYRRILWSEEYYEQEPLVNALVDREIDQSMPNQEIHVPEEKEDEAEAFEIWQDTLNRDIGQNGGLREYNRAMMLDLALTGLVVTLANWGPITTSKNKTYKFPKLLVNLSAKSLLPHIDPFSGKREYFYQLTQKQYESVKRGQESGITQIIPNAKALLQESIDLSDGTYRTVNTTGPWLKIPIEDGYVISLRSRQNDLWPKPTLVPIFSAIAMKRKLALADWAVADGMVNMIMVWSFPPGTKPSAAKNVVTKFMQGGRVQSHAVPAGVEVKMITPDSSILNSAQKFWQPISEIYEHFGFNISASSRASADIDSPGLESSSNNSRYKFWRDTVSDHNDYWLRQIKIRNNFDFHPESVFQSRDLDNDANFRTFASSMYDRGLLSIESILDLAQTSIERESARRKAEKEKGLQDIFEIRPSYAQQTLPSAGRPPSGSPKSKTEPVSKPKAKNKVA